MSTVIIVTTMGFTESLALRGLLKRGIKENDKVVVVRPKDREERADQAYEAFKLTLQKLGYREPIELRVDVGDFEGTVAFIAAKLEELYDGEGIYANLSGGMRLLILEVLLGILHSAIKAEIEVFSEDGKTSVTFTPDVFRRPDVRSDELEILHAFGNKLSVTEIAEETGFAKSKVSRGLKRLREMKLIDERGEKLTTLGKIYVKYYELKRKLAGSRTYQVDVEAERAE